MGHVGSSSAMNHTRPIHRSDTVDADLDAQGLVGDNVLTNSHHYHSMSEMSESSMSTRRSSTSSHRSRRRASTSGVPSTHFGDEFNDPSKTWQRRESGDSSVSGASSSKRNSRPGRRQTMMMTIAEVPSQADVMSQATEEQSQRRHIAQQPQVHTIGMGAGMTRNRGSMEQMDLDAVDSEMRRRGAPAAPQYRILPKGHNSMW